MTSDDEANWVTTSMARNSAKMNWTLDELGWSLHPSGDVGAWDGLLGWFLDYATRHPEMLASSMVRQWHRAGSHALQLIEEIKSARTDNPTSRD